MNKKFKDKIKRAYWILKCQFGIDPIRTVRALFELPRYFVAMHAFRKKYHGAMEWVPCLHDRSAEGGTTGTEYFWQDLLVARMIHKANPERHVDIGSRIDGFIAHVASFRAVEVFDIRPVKSNIPGVTFKQADFMAENSILSGYSDSLSCLHTIEHFGLGRYGDPITTDGHLRGLTSMARLIRTAGTFYLSAPIGRERVEFNANRVFNPIMLAKYVVELGFSLHKFIAISEGSMREFNGPDLTEIQKFADVRYVLGVFVFNKL